MADEEQDLAMGPGSETPGHGSPDPEMPAQPSAFPIVGIGASAGGLEAFGQFFSKMPADTGMAFVLVQHLDPHHASRLPELLGRYTSMPVLQATEDMKIKPNSVYIIPPNKVLVFRNGRLSLLQQKQHPGIAHNIDIFLKSLAEQHREKAICIILSGTGTDGTVGLRAIKAGLGLTVVQDPESATHEGMPRSAIATGLVDFVLPPQVMPGKLVEYFQAFIGVDATRRQESLEQSTDLIRMIFKLLRTRFNIDFTGYKIAPLRRRIERRMAVNRIDDLGGYVEFLEEHPDEGKRLFQSFLINVTGFFRDPEAFEVLKREAMALIRTKPAGSLIRAWVPGCASGEEAFSVGMLLAECTEELGRGMEFQVFATDVDEDAVSWARRGFYPSGIAPDVGGERLKRFFLARDGGYEVRKEIRDRLVFARQDVINDAPFSRLDFISCRNLLIYLKPEIQKGLLTRFHYALNPEGILLLGSSESVGQFTDLFRIVERKWRLFERQGTDVPAWARFNSPQFLEAEASRPVHSQQEGPSRRKNIPELAEAMLSMAYIPPAVVVDSSGQVVYFHGKTGKYLQPAPGQPTWNILEMAREGLAAQLSAAIRKAMADKSQVTYEGVRVSYSGGGEGLVRLTVMPVPDAPDALLLVVFEDVKTALAEIESQQTGRQRSRRIPELEHELKTTRESLQVAIEDLEASNEELRSSNEEFQSTNEELQSVNEELETSREELQSLNEELLTTNQELQKKTEEAARLLDDMRNLLDSTRIATIFLDSKMRIMRFTPEATKVFNFISTDVGRPISHVTSRLQEVDLEKDGMRVLDSLAPVEEELESSDGSWYKMRVLPYRTGDHVILGVVVTFFDITEHRRLIQNVSAAFDYVKGIADTLPLPLMVMDKDLRVTLANRAFYETFKATAKQTEGVLIYEVGNGQWNIPELRKLLEEVLPENSILEGYIVEQDFPAIGRRRMRLNAMSLFDRHGSTDKILLIMDEDRR